MSETLKKMLGQKKTAAYQKLIDKNGRLMIEKADLLAYAHGQYFSLGKSLMTFGQSVRRKKRR